MVSKNNKNNKQYVAIIKQRGLNRKYVTDDAWHGVTHGYA